jgi:hypothetical protein
MTKTQIPIKSQFPMSNVQRAWGIGNWNLVIGISLGFGFWSLGFLS